MLSVGRLSRQLVISIALIVGVVACGGGASPTPTVADSISFWVRGANGDYNKALVNGYNATHKTQVQLTVVPDGEFIAKFGTSSAAGTVPDLIASDVIYMPALTKAGQLTDITTRVNGLSFAKTLSPAYVRTSTYNGKIYGVPQNTDGSTFFWNKDLFRKAGLDPEKAPSSWQEIAAASKKITALGKDTYGFYFSGNCAGCNAYTFLPLIWASGGDVLSSDGTKATMDSPAVSDALNFYHQLWVDKQVPASAKTDNGSNFLTAFASGKIGMEGLGAFAIGALKSQYPNLNFGVGYLPGKSGGKAAFAGGDVAAIPRGAKHPNESWDFVSWMLSNDTQVEIVAKGGGLTARTDLATNKYSQQDPRVVVNNQALEQGHTPYLVRYNDIFNDSNGPWLKVFQQSVFDGNTAAAVKEAQKTINQIVSGS